MTDGSRTTVCQEVEANDDDRRALVDRRDGRDRRDSGEHQPASSEPRAYGFREFDPRRASQDRRLYGVAGDWRPAGTTNTAAAARGDAAPTDGEPAPTPPANEPEAGAPANPAVRGLLPLTHDQLRALLRKAGR